MMGMFCISPTQKVFTSLLIDFRVVVHQLKISSSNNVYYVSVERIDSCDDFTILFLT